MATIASLVVAVSATTAPFRRHIRGAGKDVGVFRKSVLSGTGALGGMKSALGMIGVSVGVAALVGQFNSLRASIDKAAKSARMLGMPVGELRGLEFAADITGLGGDRMAAALKTMAKRLGEAARGSGAATAALKEMGLEAKDLIRMDLSGALVEMADRYAEVETDSQRAAIAANIFSKANVDMGLLLAEGSKGIRELVAEFYRLRGAADEGTGSIENFNDSMTRFDAWFGGKKEAAVIGIAKAVDLLSEAIDRLGSKESGTGKKFVGVLSTGGLEAMGQVIDRFRSLIGWAEPVAEAIKKKTIAELADEEAAIAATAAMDKYAESIQKLQAAARKGMAGFAKSIQDQIGILKGVDPLDIQLTAALDAAAKHLDPGEMAAYRSVLTDLVDDLMAARVEKEKLDKQLAAADEATRAAERIKQMGQNMMASLRTPAEQFTAELLDIRRLYKAAAIDKQTYQRAIDAGRDRLTQSLQQQFREPTLVGAARKGSAAAYESMAKAQAGGDRQAKMQKALESLVREAVKQTIAQESIDRKTQQAKIAQVPP